ncbi:hypothetical protein HH308_19890 [Gordonia sp. TBRC 11910]|uniref:Uncharacterized protein n=1 Tax=Gordonia asplenii TaxID=2725283 RepID=A0A848KXV1_9ACTN|nr:hypothetical protein [Gordonia asplenii]NMO03480.1 hypothetical protein [Gordonia asplenii]
MVIVTVLGVAFFASSEPPEMATHEPHMTRIKTATPPMIASTFLLTRLPETPFPLATEPR